MKENNFEVYKSFLENKYAKTMQGGVICNSLKGNCMLQNTYASTPQRKR